MKHGGGAAPTFREFQVRTKSTPTTGLGLLVALSVVGCSTQNLGTLAPIAMGINAVRTFDAPKGVLTTEIAATEARHVLAPPRPVSAVATAGWPSYNQNLASDRFSPLDQITKDNVARLRVICTYDTRQYTSFEVGPIVVDGALIATTEHDIFSLDPATCKENWRTAETYKAASPLRVNRGAAYMDGMLFRGTEDGRVLAYDFATGKRLWATSVGDPLKGETTPAAPIAWNGLVFIGSAGGDNKGVRGRMYALDAKTGEIVWEFYLVPMAAGDKPRGPLGATPLTSASWQNKPDTPITGGGTWTSYTLDVGNGTLYVPSGNPGPDFNDRVRGGDNLYTGSVVALDAKTGAYKAHYPLAPHDWHDWDVSSAPALITTWGGKRLLAAAPKDGNLFGIDLDSGKTLYKTPVTRRLNPDLQFSERHAIHFCPGSSGGAEWNGPAYDPMTNLVLVGEVDWCTTVTLESEQKLVKTPVGEAWTGMATIDPYHTYGVMDPISEWAGWVYAVDADSGQWTWRVKTNFPILGGITPTLGGVTFFGDMGGNFYAVDSKNGQKLYGSDLGGAIGGGVISYTAGGNQRIAVAVGFTSFVWPTKVVTGKLVVLGL